MDAHVTGPPLASERRGEYRFVERMRGGSGSLLIQGPDSRRWVMKPRKNRQGDALVCNEIMGAIFLRAVGLPSLPWRSIILDALLFKQAREAGCDLDPENLDIEHFASFYVGEPEQVTSPLAIEPENSQWINALAGLYVFDLWAAHVDRREVMAAINRESGTARLFAVDNGHLFFGPHRTCAPDSKVIRSHLSETMRSVIARPTTQELIQKWIVRLRCVLPRFIEREIGGPPATFGENALLRNPECFLQRLRLLDRLVEVDLIAWGAPP